MEHTTTAAAAIFAATFAAFAVGHQAGDYWVQTHHQACTKGAPGRVGRWACAKHVLTYTATLAACLTLVAACLGLPIDPARAAAGLTVSAVTHYWADRRAPLRKLVARLGKTGFWNHGEGLASGAAHLDQSWHWIWIGAAALITATS